MRKRDYLKAKMKIYNARVVLLLMAALVMISLSSCSDTDPAIPPLEDPTIELELTADSDFDELDDLVASGVLGSESDGGRVKEEFDARFDCAIITLNTSNKTITIDFGEGCTGPHGRVRSGRILITYQGLWFLPGSKTTYELDNFAIDGRMIEGTRVVENISQSIQDVPTFHITLTGGKITFLDGSVATREVDRTRTWIRGASPAADEFHILEGSTTSGVNRLGESYEGLVLTDLVYKRSCQEGRRFLPVSGQKQITKGDTEIIVDFGDGSCDDIVTITSEGTTRTVEISPSDSNS